MSGLILLSMAPGAGSGPVVRARHDSIGEGSRGSGGMLARFRSRTGSVSAVSAASGSGSRAGGSTAPPPVNRPIVHRAYSASVHPSASVLPSYPPGSADVPIPTYESVLSESANRIREMRMSALATENYGSLAAAATPMAGSSTEGGTGDYFSAGGTQARIRRLGGMTESAVTDDSDEDDPLVPRMRRSAPTPNLRPLRRNTFSGTSSEADAAGSVRLGPVREGPLTPPMEIPPDDEDPEEAPPPALADDDRGPTASGSTDAQGEVTTIDPNRHALALGAGGTISATIDLPAPPANALPAYSANLGPQELRLISTVHMDEHHPAAAFFNALATSAVSAAPVAPTDPQRDQPQEYNTGGKRIKLYINRGGVRMNPTQTGPLYIKVGRGGKIEGRIEVGKVDYALSLEISIVGLVNTSYYVRGQYTLIDTLPLVRRQLTLYPPPAGEAGPVDLGPENLYGIDASAAGTTAAGATAAAPPESTAGPSTAATTANNVASASTVPGTSAPAQTPSTSTEAAAAAAPLTTAPQPVTPAPTLSKLSRPSFLKSRKTNPNAKIMTKEGVLYLTQGQTFPFALTMPNQHYRDANVELPPSCQIYQVGMQAGVEYVLRVKMGRKGWRLNETITLPLVYEPRAYITPRRLRALTTDDPMNPGWRTIRLHGGKPSPKAAANATAAAQDPPAPLGPGVEGILLLPSPPILYVPHGQAPPPIPFHLHFHSPLHLPLSTFSDPSESNFIIRLMRVATLRIGSEKEIRRMEIPSSIEIWQEGGARVGLGDEGSVSGHGVSVRVLDPGPAPPPTFNESNAQEAAAAAERAQEGEVWEEVPREALQGETGSSNPSVVWEEAPAEAMPGGDDTGLVRTASQNPSIDSWRSADSGTSPNVPAPGATSGSTVAATSAPQQTPATVPRPALPAVSTSPTVSTPPTRPTILSPTSPTSPVSTSSTETGGRRRLSFLRRRSSTTTITPAQPSRQADSALARILSNIPPSISEGADPGPAPSSPAVNNTSSTAGPSTAAASGSAPAQADGELPTNVFAPLGLGSTDVHLLGELTIPHKITGTDVVRRITASFGGGNDISVSYVLEVGIQPKRGAVKEAFEHLWGGGIVEIILGNKIEEAVEAAVEAGIVPDGSASAPAAAAAAGPSGPGASGTASRSVGAVIQSSLSQDRFGGFGRP